jgi:hypothetical protein
LHGRDRSDRKRSLVLTGNRKDAQSFPVLDRERNRGAVKGNEGSHLLGRETENIINRAAAVDGSDDAIDNFELLCGFAQVFKERAHLSTRDDILLYVRMLLLLEISDDAEQRAAPRPAALKPLYANMKRMLAVDEEGRAL